MFLRMVVKKATGTEEIHVDMPSWNPITGVELDVTPEDMKRDISHVMSILDDRAADAQVRMLEAYGILKYFPEQYQVMILQIIDILCGKADPALVVQRWHAAAEETLDLEQGRIDHAVQNGMVDKT